MNQHSGEDFHTEAAKMCDIYRDSILTIAASCSASDCAGFLQDRIIEDAIELNGPPRFQSVRFRQTIDHSRMFRDDPIHARAWTFQETILPRRLLSFGSREATWECEAVRKCECRQIEYENETKTTDDELGRAAYRKYTRPVIQGRSHPGNNYDLPEVPAHLRGHVVDPRMLNNSIPEPYAAELPDKASSIENQDAGREYIKSLQRRTARTEIAATSEFAHYFDAFLSDDPEPYLQDTLSRGATYIVKEVRPENGPLHVGRLQNPYRNTLAVSAFHRYWRRVLVPEYTRRALSKDSDRLIALQAIASDIHTGIHNRYLAGLWEGDLVNQLCWQSADGQGLPADNQSPSWSWSSIRGSVVPLLSEDFENRRFDMPELTIVSASCVQASGNPCGRIVSGLLTLRASAMEVLYHDNKFSVNESIAEYKGETRVWPLKLNFSPDAPIGCHSDGSLTRSAVRQSRSTERDDYDPTVILLFIKFTENNGSMDCCVLVCSRVSSGAHACRRLGIGTVSWEDIRRFFYNPRNVVTGEFMLI